MTTQQTQQTKQATVDKVLINQNFKALRVGSFVEANESDGEFILTRDPQELPLGTLMEISKANKLNIKRESKEKVCEKFVCWH